MRGSSTTDEISCQEEEPPPSLGSSHQTLSDYKYVRYLIEQPDFETVTERYPFVTTSYYLSLAKPSPDNPIMKQLCPSLKELEQDHNQSKDPLDEEGDSPVPGLVHRYPDRVLLILTNRCYMNCRHCTRKRIWKDCRYDIRSQKELNLILDYLENHQEVRDVIISGGDPLTLSDEFLDNLLANLRQIPHLEIIRIGTRAPVVFPMRITAKLVRILKKHRPIWLNTQFNHIQEITSESAQAVQRIMEAGIPVNNQTVLLKGINDSAEAMTQLCHGLLKLGVRPYYLFLCDPVAGVSHVRTSISKGIEVIEKMRGHTSGLAVPNFVVDAVRGGGKIPLQPKYLLHSNGDNSVLLRNYKGERFVYYDYPPKTFENWLNL